MASNNPNSPILSTIYDGWETYQSYLMAAISPLTPEQLDLRAAPNLRAVGDLIAHIVATRVSWFHRTAGAGSPDLAHLARWGWDDQDKRTPAELIGGVEASWQLVKDALATWTPADLEAPLRKKDWQGVEQTYTRQWIVWHVLENDLHHGGELSYSLGMHGLAGLDV